MDDQNSKQDPQIVQNSVLIGTDTYPYAKVNVPEKLVLLRNLYKCTTWL